MGMFDYRTGETQQQSAERDRLRRERQRLEALDADQRAITELQRATQGFTPFDSGEGGAPLDNTNQMIQNQTSNNPYAYTASMDNNQDFSVPAGAGAFNTPSDAMLAFKNMANSGVDFSAKTTDRGLETPPRNFGVSFSPLNPPRTPAPTDSTPVPIQTPQERLEQLNLAQTLREPLIDVLGYKLFGASRPQYKIQVLNALESIGLSRDIVSSEDPVELQNAINLIIQSNILADPIFDTAGTEFAIFPGGQSQEQNRLERAKNQNQRLSELLGQGASTDAAAVTETPSEVIGQSETLQPSDQRTYMGDPTMQPTPQAAGSAPGLPYDAIYESLANARGGSADARLPREVLELANMPFGTEGQGQAQDFVNQFNRALDQQQQSDQQKVAAIQQAGASVVANTQASSALNVVNAQISGQADIADMQNATNKYAIAMEGVRLTSAQNHAASEGALDRAAQTAISSATNISQQAIAGMQTQAQIAVANTNKMSASEVATINRYSASEAATITGRSKEDVARIQGQYQFNLGQLTNSTNVQIAQYQENARLQAARDNILSANYIANLNTSSAQLIAATNKSSALEVATAQATAAQNVATANNTTAQAIATLQGDDAYALSLMQISNQFANEKEISLIQKEYQKELATLTGTTEEQIAALNNQAVISVKTMEIQGTKDAVDAQIAFETQQAATQRTFEGQQAELARNQQTSLATGEQGLQRELASGQQGLERELATGEQTFQSGQATAQRAFETEQAALNRQAEAEAIKVQYLNNLQPAEYSELQKDIARGGLTVEESESLAALVARGGLSAEQRISEMNAESRSDEMNAFIALLSNPSALGAFVTAISGELPFEAVPTMSQLADMTPNRIQYLQGALSALGIDPQTFIRMAQDVTPQAFQDTGPFSQITAMVS